MRKRYNCYVQLIFLEGFFLSSFYVFISMITVVDAFGLGCAVKRSRYRQQQKMASYYDVVIHNDVTFGFRARVQFLPIINRVIHWLLSFICQAKTRYLCSDIRINAPHVFRLLILFTFLHFLNVFSTDIIKY